MMVADTNRRKHDRSMHRPDPVRANIPVSPISSGVRIDGFPVSGFELLTSVCPNIGSGERRIPTTASKECSQNRKTISLPST